MTKRDPSQRFRMTAEVAFAVSVGANCVRPRTTDGRPYKNGENTGIIGRGGARSSRKNGQSRRLSLQSLEDDRGELLF